MQLLSYFPRKIFPRIYAVDAERCKFRRERRLVTKQQRVYRFLIHVKSLYYFRLLCVYGAAGYLLPSRPQFSRGSFAVRTKLFRFVTCCDFIPDHERLIEARRKPTSRMLFSLVLILGFIAFCYCIVVVFYVSPSLRACVHKGFPIPMQGLGNQSKRQPKADAFLSGRRSRLKIVLCGL